MQPRFVGRSAELDELVGRFEDALAGRSGVALVAGEPGIGKTRLVTEACRIAGARAVPTLWGACTDEEGAPAYWPWRQIVRGWIAAGRPASEGIDDVVGELARIAPELGVPDPSAGPGPEQRFATFDAAATFVARAAAPGGLVLVLDDAQWADPASMALLVHLARHVRGVRLLLAVTYRTRELAADPVRAAAVADIAQLPDTVRLELRGLDEAAVQAALTDRLGAPPSVEIVTTVVRRTRGNPFFVGELGRMLADPGEVGQEVPGAVRDAVRRRLDRLPSSCRAALDVAAVAGRELDLVLLAGAAGRSAETLLDDVTPAIDEGILERPHGRTRLRFSHDLVRETLLVELTPAQRAGIHHRVATLLEPAADDPDVAPELAHHALSALPLGDRTAAVGWARAAAAQAMAQLAHEDAARLYALAVDAGRAVLPATERADLLLATARAHAAANDVATATQLCTEAADLARHAGEPELLGRAALVMPGVSDAGWLAASGRWCAEALAGMDEADSPLRAMLLAQTCHAMMSGRDREGMIAASAVSLAMAERLDDRESLVSALRARQLARSGADGNAERTVLGSRMVAVGEAAGAADTVMWGRLWLFDAFLQAGRIVDAERELDRLEPVVDRLRLPLARLHLVRSKVALAIGRGRFAEAGALNDEARSIAVDGGHTGALLTAQSITFTRRIFTGPTPDGIAALEALAEADSPFAAVVRSNLAMQYISVRRLDRARHWYATLPPPDSSRVPPFLTLPLDALHAQLATDLSDTAGADACYRVLLPFAHLHVVGGAGAITTGGSVQLYLGIAALGAGRADAAVRHLRTAISANEAAGLAPFTAMARYRLAAALRARGRPTDSDEAAALLAAADTAADRMGMAPLRADIADLSTALRDGGLLSRRESEIAQLVADGLTNRQIAAAAHISERTVESHVQHILAKLGFTSRSQIAAWSARRTG